MMLEYSGSEVSKVEVERSKVVVRVTVQQLGVGWNSMSAV